MDHSWWADGYLVGYPFMALASLAFACLFFLAPNLADRFYRGLGLRITPERGRILGYLFLTSVVYFAVMFLAYVL